MALEVNPLFFSPFLFVFTIIPAIIIKNCHIAYFHQSSLCNLTYISPKKNSLVCCKLQWTILKLCQIFNNFWWSLSLTSTYTLYTYFNDVHVPFSTFSPLICYKNFKYEHLQNCLNIIMNLSSYAQYLFNCNLAAMLRI